MPGSVRRIFYDVLVLTPLSLRLLPSADSEPSHRHFITFRVIKREFTSDVRFNMKNKIKKVANKHFCSKSCKCLRAFVIELSSLSSDWKFVNKKKLCDYWFHENFPRILKSKVESVNFLILLMFHLERKGRQG